MNKKIIITTGGTGGHIYPSLSLAKQLEKVLPSASITFMGGGLEKNPYFDRAAYPYHQISTAPLSLKGIFSLVYGTFQSIRLLWKSKPDLVVGFGSYYTVPVLLAAVILRKKIALHEANSIPGKTNRLFSPFALFTGVQFPCAKEFLKGVCLEADLPLRDELRFEKTAKKEARDYFGLRQEGFVWLIFGGSQGARAINEAVLKELSALSKKGVQLIILTGEQESVASFEKALEAHQIQACVKAFEKRMDLAWVAADAALTRAGAGTVVEALNFLVPLLLVPYEKAADSHQEKNARFITETIGGGMLLFQGDLKEGVLFQSMETMEKLASKMKEAMQTYQEKAPSRELCQLIRGVL